MSIILSNITKSYGDQMVLNNISLDIARTETTVLMGKSGRGKTTLLRILAGLEVADTGTIDFGLKSDTGTSPKISMVFQEDRLCENLSALTNIRLVCPHIDKDVVLRAIDALDLCDGLHKPARELSGGMKRRVAILRALLSDYDILIMDEPFKGLDEDTKRIVMDFVCAHIQEKTALIVTHDRREAEMLGATNIIEL
ncbi:MAG: ATP-binding cassette domain-containing protein [Clostridiales Family XIII bacterium]|jgi:NitT/TauT family transport system ATP-binding protein|nr:ATP-binding cassette domain-containing protein [Clostridiales Family XIII bacterium]